MDLCLGMPVDGALTEVMLANAESFTSNEHAIYTCGYPREPTATHALGALVLSACASNSNKNEHAIAVDLCHTYGLHICLPSVVLNDASTALLLGTRNLLAMEHACRREVGTLPTVSYAMHLAVIKNEPWVDTV